MMKWKSLLCLAFLPAVVPAFGTMLSITLDSQVLVSAAGNEVFFTGTITDLDTDDSQTFLNDISIVIPPADSFLLADTNTFFSNVPGFLTGSVFNGTEAYAMQTSYTGVIFGVNIDPSAPPGAYGSPSTADLTVTLLGGADGGTFDPLATTVNFEVVVGTPEPAVTVLTLSGLAGLALIRRRRHAAKV